MRKNLMSEDISIVMAVYNHETTLKDALESALMQKMPYSSKIYCINDASTDNSAMILAEYARNYPDKIFVFTSNENQGSGKKAFLHNKPPAEGRYWCLLAGDDYWTTPDKLNQQLVFLDDNEEYVGCSCNTLMRNELDGSESIIKPDCEYWNILDTMLLSNRYRFYVHTTSIVWRNIYLDKGFFLPPDFKKSYASGDVLLAHMMLASGMKMHNIDKVMSCYRVTGKGVWTSKTLEQQKQSNLEITAKLKRATPIKYSLYARMNGLKEKFPLLGKFIPGPING
jgi:glycosyltransferase involved in cell wall biosynthesis